MAKTKISELVKKYGVESKEILDCLHENGVEAKTANSSVEDSAVAILDRKFSGRTGKEAPVEETSRDQTPKKKVSGVPAEKKPAGTGEVRKVRRVVSANAQAGEKPAAPHKKRVIIVTTGNAGNRPQNRRPNVVMNTGNAQGRGQNSRNNNYSSGTGNERRGNTFTQAPQHHIIRPKTVPSQMEVDYHKPVAPQPKKAAPKPEPEMEQKESAAMSAASEAAASQEQTAAAAPVKEVSTAATAEAPQAATTAEAPKAAAGGTEEKAAPAAEQKATAQASSEEDTGKAKDGNAKNETQAAQQTPQPAGESRKPESESHAGAVASATSSAAAPQGRKTVSAVRRPQDIPYIIDPAVRRRNENGGQPVSSSRTGTRGGQNRNSQGGGYQSRGGQGGYRNSQGGYQGQNRYGAGRPGAGYQGRGGQEGGFRGNGNAGTGRGGQGGRPAFGGAGNRRFGGRPAPGGNGDTFVKDAEKHRDADRRKAGQERDKRNRKDYMYNEEESRQKKAGRFIRPEKVTEEAPEEKIRTISVPDKITIRDLAAKMHIHDADIIKKLFLEGRVTTPNTELTYEEVENIAVEYDILCEKEEKVDVIEELLKEDEDPEDTLVPRPPVVCVMGHVDHGKTTLLAYIRAMSHGIFDEDKKTRQEKLKAISVANKEAGGITQAIGAYQVEVKDRKITFLDTPGHEAFTAMRMRGAKSTDIAILVVAADDGVMPQTVEAINHAKAAGVEIIVAINKIDKPGANIDNVKTQLTQYGLTATDWGGETEMVPVSARSGQGVDDLLDTVLLTADILELKANPNRKARGLVLEARLDKGRGPVANVLIQKGTLHVGDFISAGAASGKVRALLSDKGKTVKEAGPSTPVEVLGLSEAPRAGEVLVAHEDDKTAKQFAETYRNQHKEDLLEETRMRMSLDDLFNQMKEGNLKEFDIIIKADVQGSVEALKASLLKLSNDEIQVQCIHSGVGNISESDVDLAAASNAVIIGFNVKTDPVAQATADREGVDIHLYNVIYNAIDEVEAAIKGMEAPVYEEKVIGHAEIRQIFKASQVGNIGGSSVLDGVVRKGCKCRITRDGKQIFEGTLASLKRFKDDVKEVKEGFECGLVFEGFDQIAVGDQVECCEMVKVEGERAAEIKAQRKAAAEAEKAARKAAATNA